MDDDTASARDYRADERSVESYGPERVRLEGLLPVVVGQVCDASGLNLGAADVVHDDVHAPEYGQRAFGDGCRPVGGGDVGGDHLWRRCAGGAARGDDNGRAS